MNEKNHLWDEGYTARRADRPLSTCPYQDLPRCLDWVQGWLDAHFQIQRIGRVNRRPHPAPPDD